MVVWKVNLNCQLIHCKTIAKSILIQEKKKMTTSGTHLLFPM